MCCDMSPSEQTSIQGTVSSTNTLVYNACASLAIRNDNTLFSFQFSIVLHRHLQEFSPVSGCLVPLLCDTVYPWALNKIAHTKELASVLLLVSSARPPDYALRLNRLALDSSAPTRSCFLLVNRCAVLWHTHYSGQKWSHRMRYENVNNWRREGEIGSSLELEIFAVVDEVRVVRVLNIGCSPKEEECQASVLSLFVRHRTGMITRSSGLFFTAYGPTSQLLSCTPFSPYRLKECGMGWLICSTGMRTHWPKNKSVVSWGWCPEVFAIVNRWMDSDGFCRPCQRADHHCCPCVW